VLAAEPQPNGPIDLTGNPIVQGDYDSYVGELTTTTGAGAAAARSLRSPELEPARPKPAVAVAPLPAVDLSRVARFSGASEWNCAFPAEADLVQSDEAYVTIEVDVAVDGAPAFVRVLSDPGNGFGREARHCAMTKRYSSALNREGQPITGWTTPFRVHFSR
jgi:protein TonB